MSTVVGCTEEALRALAGLESVGTQVVALKHHRLAEWHMTDVL
jgi:hypothetical protein